MVPGGSKLKLEWFQDGSGTIFDPGWIHVETEMVSRRVREGPSRIQGGSKKKPKGFLDGPNGTPSMAQDGSK
jgi:hypothetical protein